MFPKIRGSFLGVPIIRIIVFWCLYWGPPLFWETTIYRATARMYSFIHAKKRPDSGFFVGPRDRLSKLHKGGCIEDYITTFIEGLGFRAKKFRVQ